MDMKLEVVVVPVFDVDQAKDFYQALDGGWTLTRRRVYVRNPDGSPVPDSVSIAVDFTDAAFS